MKILITGSKGGIGYHLGIKLAKRSHFVYMTTHTDEQKDKLQQEINKLNLKHQIKVFKLDITSKKDRQLIDNLDIDVLYTHAGVGEGGSILKLPIDKIKYNYEVNVFSTIELIKRYYKRLTETNKKGKVIITSSIAGLIPIQYLGSYTSSKAALSMLVRTINKELKIEKAKLKVYLVEPGAYKTGFNQVMIDKIGNYDNVDQQLKLTNIFNLIERRRIDSVVNKMISLSLKDSYKLRHRVPLLQRIFIKIYLIFCG